MKRVLAFLFAFTFILQAQHKGIIVNLDHATLDRSTAGVPAQTYLNGYRKSISGQTIEYHSAHPDANRALLVRAKRDIGSISWESDTLRDAGGAFYDLLWLAGIEKSGWQQPTPHRFELSVNGERWFTFKNLKDSSAMTWRIPGRNGSALSFTSLVADRFGDLFGYMTLRLPRSDFPVGSPVTLEVRGEDAESPDWFMTFEYSFAFKPRMRLEPALLRNGSAPSQMIRLSLDNLTPGSSVTITAPDQEVMRRSLIVGGNIFFIPVEEVLSEAVLPVTFSVDGERVEQETVTIKPIVRREIYLLSYSHNDIGYTDLQPTIEKKQMQNLDRALELIRQTTDYPPEAQYRWNMEVLWVLESYLRQASEDKKNEVIGAIRNGRIGLNALYANVLTGLANGVEMMHFTQYARRFSREYSVPITTACVSDIPGFTWGIVTALAKSGVKYFLSAPNSGDRVGHAYELGDKPFYWGSRSGEDSVLTWIAAASYSSFHEGDLSRLGDEKILKLMRTLDDRHCPYEIVPIPYTIGGDNGPPDPDLSEFVRRWNERYVSPRLVIGTHEQMFSAFEERYGSALPKLRGDFTPYWEDGAFSTAKETFQNRHAVDRLIQSEVLWSLRSPADVPMSTHDEAWRQVVLYDEHTWGAHNSITTPDSPFVKDQWRIKRQFAVEADSISRALMGQALGTPTPHQHAIIDVYNTHSWVRTDLVHIPRESSTAGDLVVDDEGRTIPSQRLSTGELAFIAADVQPYSRRRYRIQEGEGVRNGSAHASGISLNNTLLSLTLHENTGSITEVVGRGRQLVKGNDRAGVNRYCYVPGRDPDSVRTLRGVRISVKERGPIVASLLIEADAPGCRQYSSEIRIIDGIERIDIINSVDKIAIREKEGMHFEFPFDIPNGQLCYDVPWGIVVPEKDQLPGACKNFLSVQSFVDISTNDYGITWATPDAPLIEVGAIQAERPWMKTLEPSQTFYSYVMNNYWHTNYKADQEGPVTIRYAIRPHAAFRAEDALRFGIEQRQPLIVALAGDSRASLPSLCTIEPTSVIITALKPIVNPDGWLAELYNASDTTQHTSIHWNPAIPVEMRLSTVDGATGGGIQTAIDIPAYGSRFIRIERKK